MAQAGGPPARNTPDQSITGIELRDVYALNRIFHKPDSITTLSLCARRSSTESNLYGHTSLPVSLPFDKIYIYCMESG